MGTDIWTEAGRLVLVTAARSLKLEWCGALRTVQLKSRSIHAVSLAGSSGIVALEVSCPALESLRLDECVELSRCVLSIPPPPAGIWLLCIDVGEGRTLLQLPCANCCSKLHDI